MFSKWHLIYSYIYIFNFNVVKATFFFMFYTFQFLFSKIPSYTEIIENILFLKY